MFNVDSGRVSASLKREKVLAIGSFLRLLGMGGILVFSSNAAAGTAQHWLWAISAVCLAVGWSMNTAASLSACGIVT